MRGKRVLIAAVAAAGLAVIFAGGFLTATVLDSDDESDEPEEVVITEGERSQLVDACLQASQWPGVLPG